MSDLTELMTRPTTGTLLRRTSRILTSSFGPFFGLSLLVHSPLLVLAAVVLAMASAELVSAEALAITLALVVVGGLLFAPLAAAAMVQGVFETLRGGKADLVVSVRVALRRIGGVIGLTLLVSLATAAGFMLCIVPGAVLSCGLFAAMPALLVEGVGVPEAWIRSWKLTGGYKASIFGVLFLLGLIEKGFGSILEATLLPGDEVSGWNFYLYLPLLLLGSVFMTTLRGIASVVAYHDLRLFTEGLEEDQLAAVFD